MDGRTHPDAVYLFDIDLIWLPAIQETQVKLHAKGLIWLGGEITNKTLPRRP